MLKQERVDVLRKCMCNILCEFELPCTLRSKNNFLLHVRTHFITSCFTLGGCWNAKCSGISYVLYWPCLRLFFCINDDDDDDDIAGEIP